MCANYEPIFKNRAQLLDLSEPTFDYKNEIYPAYNSPIIIAKNESIEWRSARFGLVPNWADTLDKVKDTHNARSETVATKPNFRHAWKNNQFCLIPVETIFEPKYIDGKPHWYGIYRCDGMPFTVAGIYEYATINGEQILSMSMLTINSESHPLMNQFHAPDEEKRSVVVISQDRRNSWLSCEYQDVAEFMHEFSANDFTAAPKSDMHKFRPKTH